MIMGSEEDSGQVYSGRAEYEQMHNFSRSECLEDHKQMYVFARSSDKCVNTTTSCWIDTSTLPSELVSLTIYHARADNLRPPLRLNLLFWLLEQETFQTFSPSKPRFPSHHLHVFATRHGLGCSFRTAPSKTALPKSRHSCLKASTSSH